MKKYNYDNAVPVTCDIFWVGYFDSESNLHCNPYILIDDHEVVFFDPGSIPHFPTVMRKVIDHVNPRDISVIVASHQDPDICGNLAVVEDVIERPDLQIAAHGHSIRFIRYYGVGSSFYQVENHDFKLTLKSGRVLEFIHTPFLHASGSIMTFDSKTRTLFSSDLFGALSDNWSLFAGKDFIKPLTGFHEIYMSTSKLLGPCVEKVRQLKPERILPQHGSILQGDQVEQAIDHLSTLPCGQDLFEG